MTGRAADASIRGYFAQVARTALEWVRLAPNEELVVEGHEDFDRKILSGTSVIEVILHQHKAQTVRVGWNNDVQHSVLAFTVSFADCHAKGIRCVPAYVSTSGMANSDLLKAWVATRSKEDSVKLALQVASDLHSHKVLKESSDFAKSVLAGVDYLDAAEGRWTAFVDATRWVFEANDYHADLKELVEVLRHEPTASGMPFEELSIRVLVSVFEVAMRKDVGTRTLKKVDLEKLLGTERKKIEVWAESSDASVFFDALSLDTLLTESRHRVEFELRRGTIDRQGGPRAPRLVAEAELRQHSGAELRVVVGERGSGKTSVVAKWASEELEQGRLVVWLSCRSTAASPEQFFRDLGCRRGLAVLQTLKLRSVTLILDALDQGRSDEARAALCALVEISVSSGVRTVAVVRLRHANTDPEVRRLLLLSGAVRLDLGSFSESELEVLAASPGTPASLAKIPTSLSAGLRRLVRLPLHVHFLWELARRSPTLDLSAITTFAQLMDRYWLDVVTMDDTQGQSEKSITLLIRLMLATNSLEARVGDPLVRAGLAPLVRADVLAHPTALGFGEVNDRFTFWIDGMFDYAVFRLLWRSASNEEVIASLQLCGSFGAGLDQSFRYLLEFREAIDGAASSIQLAAALYVASDLGPATKEMVASEFVIWMSKHSSRMLALVQMLSSVDGTRQLLSRAASLHMGET